MMGAIDELVRFHIQGERPGMKAGFEPSPELVKFVESQLTIEGTSRSFIPPSILIEQTVRVADISFWQGVVDFDKMREAGLFGVFLRAGQRTWADSRFILNTRGATLAKLPWGSYWFYDSREDPVKQAELWWSLIKDNTGQLPHVADFEESYGGPFGSKAHMRKFLEHFMSISKLPVSRILIYTGFYWWVARIGNDPWFKKFRLWIASYGTMASARIPAPWVARDLVFWQYTPSGDGTLFGVSSKEIDLNWFCCSALAFVNQFPLVTGQVPEPPVEPPNQGEPMEAKVKQFTNLREQPLEFSRDLGDLLAGDIVTYTTQQLGTDGKMWCWVTKAMRGNLPVRRTDGKLVNEAPCWAWANNLQPLTQPSLPEIPVRIEIGDDVNYAKIVYTTTMKPK